jgi:hypothetical protein
MREAWTRAFSGAPASFERRGRWGGRNKKRRKKSGKK